ncbi:MAG: hypothetical protein IPO09_13475 [Anaeromyxobacter sp.]|nr:hypothetical protein [Anaeromyxobacter sp.]MBL0275194.1 hypothetical protein [Anaeromyxobacter sp.]
MSPLPPRWLLALLLASLAPAARALDLGARLGQEASASVAVASGRATAAASWLLVLEPLPGRLQLGAGARLMGFGGFEPIDFSTGDPELIASGQTTSLAVSDARVLSLNLVVQAVVRLVGPLEAGANIDLAGFSLGPERTGDHRTSDPAFAGPRPARVSSPNLLLIGDRDRGQLDSEFFLGWRVTEALTVRAGLGHVATEYLTLDPVDSGNRRFRRFTNQPFLGLAWRLR